MTLFWENLETNLWEFLSLPLLFRHKFDFLIKLPYTPTSSRKITYWKLIYRQPLSVFVLNQLNDKIKGQNVSEEFGILLMLSLFSWVPWVQANTWDYNDFDFLLSCQFLFVERKPTFLHKKFVCVKTDVKLRDKNLARISLIDFPLYSFAVWNESFIYSLQRIAQQKFVSPLANRCRCPDTTFNYAIILTRYHF